MDIRDRLEPLITKEQSALDAYDVGSKEYVESFNRLTRLMTLYDSASKNALETYKVTATEKTEERKLEQTKVIEDSKLQQTRILEESKQQMTREVEAARLEQERILEDAKLQLTKDVEEKKLAVSLAQVRAEEAKSKNAAKDSVLNLIGTGLKTVAYIGVGVAAIAANEKGWFIDKTGLSLRPKI